MTEHAHTHTHTYSRMREHEGKKDVSKCATFTGQRAGKLERSLGLNPKAITFISDSREFEFYVVANKKINTCFCKGVGSAIFIQFH